MAQAGQCDLLYFDESGFSPNPPLQYGWAPTGHSRCVEAGAHRQRVNVLGALGHDGKLLWASKEQRAVRDDVIAFFDRIAQQPHPVPCIVVLDNANIHRGEAMELKRPVAAPWPVLTLSAAIQSGAQSHRNPLEAGQVLLAQVRSPDRQRTA